MDKASENNKMDAQDANFNDVKAVAIIQSNYIPWKGYFDLINSADELIIYDEVQYTKNDWRNRNQIMTNTGPVWLTIPVNGSITQNINQVTCVDNRWRKKHWNTVSQSYAKAAYFSEFKEQFESLYLECNFTNLSLINEKFIRAICQMLNIETKITRVESFELSETDRTKKLVELCQLTGSNQYISGPAAKSYLDEAFFSQEKIAIKFADYDGYPEYSQQSKVFMHNVSVLDLIFNVGANACSYMKSFEI